MYNHYNINLKGYARELRNESVSKAEKYIWKNVLSRNRMGVKFKRQRPIDRFIVDFFAQEIGLIVEIDGSSHLTRGAYDAYRQERLETMGYTVVRFYEGEVMLNLGEVMEQLEHVVFCLKGGIK